MIGGRWVRHGVNAVETIDRAISVGTGSTYGARSLYVAVPWLVRHGQASRRHVAAETLIGSDLYHSTGDRQKALAQLAADFAKFTDDLTAQVPLTEPWISIDVKPTLDEWLAFHDREEASWLARVATDWDEFEHWHERLKRLRELARAHGLVLASAEPIGLPETIWEQGAEGRGGHVSVLVTLLKVAIYAAIGLTGFVALWVAWRDIRGHGRMAVHP